MSTLDPRALSALKNNQRQLDADGVEVGVSRQALDELIMAYEVDAPLSQPQAGEPVAWRYKLYATDADWTVSTTKPKGALVEPLYASPQPANPAQPVNWPGRCGMLIDLIEHMNATGESVEGEDLDMVETFKADLTAAIGAGSQPALAVKGLVWNEGGFAHTNTGIFYRMLREPGFWKLEAREGSSTTNSAHPTEEAAKAAAQADYETRIRSALVASPVTDAIVETAYRAFVNAPGSDASAMRAALGAAALGASPSMICDVLIMRHSSGFPDYFTRIRVGDRDITTYMSKIKGQCEYHAAEFNWLLNGADKPDILAFDYADPEGLADYLKSIASPPPSGEVERAREIVKTNTNLPPDAVNAGIFDETHAMRCTIAALSSAPATADGWRMVPVEPTEEMMKAGGAAAFDADSHGDHWLARANAAYRAMIAAAPTATGGR